jgi:SAM-dependent methyltransferase
MDGDAAPPFVTQPLNTAIEDASIRSKSIVKEGYDRIAQRYLEWTSKHSCPRITYLKKLLNLLAPGSLVLELGCGAGTPGTRLLADNNAVTANDISETQISLARKNAPSAKFIPGDMMSLSFAAGSFDATVALYSIIHLPRSEQEMLIQRVSAWLRPGGYFLLNVGTEDNPGYVDSDWLGSRMYWSGFGENVYRDMVRQAGLEDIDVEVLQHEEDGRLIPFLWMLLRKR